MYMYAYMHGFVHVYMYYVCLVVSVCVCVTHQGILSVGGEVWPAGGWIEKSRNHSVSEAF